MNSIEHQYSNTVLNRVLTTVLSLLFIRLSLIRYSFIRYAIAIEIIIIRVERQIWREMELIL